MSLAQRFERRLESVVGSAFARVFKGQVEPVEIATALQREATDKRNVMGTGEVLAPNRYRVTLSPSDYERLVPWEAQLTNSLAELVQEHLDQNGWRPIGGIEVYLARDDALHMAFWRGVTYESNAPPRRRPAESLRCRRSRRAPGAHRRPGPGRMPRWCSCAQSGARTGHAAPWHAAARSAAWHATRTAGRRAQRSARGVSSAARRCSPPRLSGRRCRWHQPSLRPAAWA